MSFLFLVDHIFLDPKEDLDAFIGLMIMASFFGIPYLVFFRGNQKNGKNLGDGKNKHDLVSKRCTFCNSSSIKMTDGGFQCEHCGSHYQKSISNYN